MIERARAEEVMVYAIGLESNYFNGQRMVRSRPDGGLRKIADETGGGYFELKKIERARVDLHQVAQELHSQYVIGFAPTLLDNRVHKLAVKMKQPGMTARARRSYVAVADKISSSGEVAARRTRPRRSRTPAADPRPTPPTPKSSIHALFCTFPFTQR